MTTNMTKAQSIEFNELTAADSQGVKRKSSALNETAAPSKDIAEKKKAKREAETADDGKGIFEGEEQPTTVEGKSSSKVGRASSPCARSVNIFPARAPR